MCARSMQAIIREYVSFHGDDSVSIRDGEDGVDEDALAKAWFPEGVVFDETAVSLGISGPREPLHIKEGWNEIL
jgi:hypothetical protein